MVAKTLTISMSEEDYEYLKEDGLLSPSKIFQVSLHNIRENRKSDIIQINLLRNKAKILQAKVFELEDKLNESKKVWEVWSDLWWLLLPCLSCNYIFKMWFCKLKSKEFDELSKKYQDLYKIISVMQIDIEALEQRFKRKIKPKKEEDLKDYVSLKKGGLMSPKQYKDYGIDW